jgi:cellulose synthase/poly-beta-1,6-N-acetylglucosamine synthase-like glycosyltransferase
MTILLLIILLAVGFFTIYLSLLTIIGFFYKSKIKINDPSQPVNEKLNRFAIVVPAHNEELVIEKTVNNLLNVDYPSELFEIIVIADNCTDKTSVLAYKQRTVVLERENKQLKGKGHALRWCIELLLKGYRKKFDAFLVIDADTVVEKNIFKVLNIYVNNGNQAIQCADLVSPQPGSWSSEITRVGLYLYNYVRPLGRKMLNLSAGLRGNGMCFTSNLLEKFPWQSYSQTEDLEYGLHLLLNGISVTFAPEAKVFAIMPINEQNAETQRARWEFGRFSVVKKYSFRLLKEAIKKRSFKIFDAFVELITPAFVNLFLITFLFFVSTFILTIIGLLESNSFLILFSALFVLQIFYVIGGLYLSKADKNAYKALWKVPKFIIWKLTLYLRLLLKGHTKIWIRTAREDAVK